MALAGRVLVVPVVSKKLFGAGYALRMIQYAPRAQWMAGSNEDGGALERGLAVLKFRHDRGTLFGVSKVVQPVETSRLFDAEVYRRSVSLRRVIVCRGG